FGVEREYAVGVHRPLDPDRVAVLDAGIRLDEGVAQLARPLRRLSRTEVGAFAQLLDPTPDPALTWYRAVLRQGWKRQLRRMFGAVEAPIARLVRVAVGPIRLGVLRSGEVRRLREPEVTALSGDRGRPARTSRHHET
ncbi:MAG TPA: hypothetical protein VET90_04870, partial [Candidatus Binatus sp.]|nr:hypothetical protein [Candidatus Binatus sp.]